jgi:Fic family protein
MNPVVAAGLAHIHSVAIHPFCDGNGRTGRALAALVLQRSPHHFKKWLSFEHTFANDREAYIDTIERSLGRSFAEEYDATPWLKFFVEGVGSAAVALEAQLTDWQDSIRVINASAADLGLRERQIGALGYAAQTDAITRKDYMEITGVKR